jgi:transketolase
VALFVNGFLVNRALEAAQLLHQAGINATVAEVATLKPLDREGVQRVLARCGCAVTIEDHVVNGALGSAVAEVIAESVPSRLVRIGLQDCYAESGFPDELLDAYGMSVDSIVQAGRRAFGGRFHVVK